MTINTRNILVRLLDDTAALFKNTSSFPETIYYLFLYLYLRLEELVLFAIPYLKTGRQKIFRHTVFYSNFSLFLNMFVSIFIEKQYDFSTNNPRPKIIDCGANIGVASLFFKLKYPGASILCFEPSSEAFKLLQKNLSCFSDIKLVNSALVGTTRKRVFLKSPKNAPGGHTDASIYNTRWDSGKIKKEKVRAVKLSNYIAKDEVIDLMKMDIEGTEEEVIKDLDSTSKLKNIKELFMEYHNYKNNSLESILNALKANGFRLAVSVGVRPAPRKYVDEFYTVLIYAYREMSGN